MTTFTWIILASLLGGVLSVAAAALFALNARAQYLGGLVSYAIGALLGVVFLDILPEAIELSPDVASVSATVLFGILLFFTLEKVLIWRHCHHAHCEAHEPHEHSDQGRS
ncbi:MAG: ZIP family metal transporter, partial [Gammaproteobacteria bacterium]|nr:ZIP family metal transporter [Gammaproteobacteria bacterium]